MMGRGELLKPFAVAIERCDMGAFERGGAPLVFADGFESETTGVWDDCLGPGCVPDL